MKKTIRILAIVAAVQLALIGITYVGVGESGTQKGSVNLLTFNVADIDTIVIAGQSQKGVTLKKGKAWHTGDGFPADSQRIITLLQRLQDMKHGLAIATSASALTRFKVDEKIFERHLLLRKGDTVLADLYLGNGAGVRHSYVRIAQAHTVYSVPLGSYDLQLQAADWQDKTVLQINSTDITAVSVRGITLTKQISTTQKSTANSTKAVQKTDVTWVSSQLPAGKQVDQDAVTHALKLLQSLRFSNVIGTVLPSDVDLTKADLDMNISYQGKQRQYHFVKQAKDYVLKVSDRPEYFRLNGYTAKELVKQMNPETWFVEKKAVANRAKPDEPQP